MGGQAMGPLEGPAPAPEIATPPLTGMHSWQDPQVFLKAASSKNVSYYCIVDFVDPHYTPAEKVISSNEDVEIIYRTGARKPKLESITVSQWSQANIAILYKLYQNGVLKQTEVWDYMSYSAHIYNLLSSYDNISVFYYDREYRRLQATHGFRWGTAVGHLAPSFLRLRAQSAQGTAGRPREGRKADRPPQRNHFQSHTGEGKVICKSYNSKGGCSYRNCRFEHACNVPACGKNHPSCAHAQSDPKN
jgi:hypothetical protein